MAAVRHQQPQRAWRGHGANPALSARMPSPAAPAAPAARNRPATSTRILDNVHNTKTNAENFSVDYVTTEWTFVSLQILCSVHFRARRSTYSISLLHFYVFCSPLT